VAARQKGAAGGPPAGAPDAAGAGPEAPSAGTGAGALSALLGPLSFAARHDFAGLDRLRGLEPLVRAKVAEARTRGGVAEEILEGLEAAVLGFDGRPADEKRAVVGEVAALLGRCLDLPAALRPATEKGAAPIPAKASPKPARRETRTPPAPDDRETATGATGGRVAMPERPPTGDTALDAPLTALSGIGAGRAAAFAARGVKTVQDALWFLPVSYERRVATGRIADIVPGTRVSVRGRVVRAGERMLGRSRRIFEVLVADESGKLRVRYYHRGGWLARKFPEGGEVGLSGTVRAGRDGVLEMAHPDLVDPAEAGGDDAPDDDDAIVPRYGEVEGVPPRTVREIVGRALPHAARLPDPIPAALVADRALLPPGEALRLLHRPPPGTTLEALACHDTEAHRRLVYEELFFLQLGLALKARGVKIEAGIAFPVDASRVAEALKLLPFAPTGAQVRCLEEIASDMARPEPMHRLLQGDVGSGKTAVAAVALALGARAGFQGAVMAPTELLADQHYRTLSAILEPAGLSVVRLSGRLGAAERRAALEAIAGGEAAVAVGTHALIQEGVAFHRLGLVVVDEQHRFGVRQRASLMEKGVRPDTLVMTATPIPRTLAMTAYGDLDLSIIDEMPPGRTPVKTKVYRASDRDRVWAEVRKRVAEGRQAYVVYPIVETSEHLEDVKAATEMAETLGNEVFPKLRVGLLHGKMAAADKDAVMAAFAGGEIHVLVATTVVEVGIDVPNATVMVVEHAERFGLSQLHQLRGRVGRGAARSHCFLVAHEVRGEKVRERLAVMEESTDGFRIAEEDLRIRGPGEVLGTRQSGHPDLLFGNLARDRAILGQARSDAFALVAADPALEAPPNRPAAREVLARWGGRIQLGRVG
jgi:ATP-dependent DNA helicase RecG